MIIFRVLGYVSHSANVETTEINNIDKCLGGDDLNVCTLRGRGYLENVQTCTRGKEREREFEKGVE